MGAQFARLGPATTIDVRSKRRYTREDEDKRPSPVAAVQSSHQAYGLNPCVEIMLHTSVTGSSPSYCQQCI